jgi:hypothetical protein
VLAAIASLASWHDVLDGAQPATTERNTAVGLYRSVILTAVTAATFLSPQKLLPVLHADEFTAGGGAPTVRG